MLGNLANQTICRRNFSDTLFIGNMEASTKIIHKITIKQGVSFDNIKKAYQEIEERLYKIYSGQTEFYYEIQIVGQGFSVYLD